MFISLTGKNLSAIITARIRSPQSRIFLSEIYALLLKSRIVRKPRFLIAATAITVMPVIKAAATIKAATGKDITEKKWKKKTVKEKVLKHIA